MTQTANTYPQPSFHYQIEKTLGDGGMGTVFLAQDTEKNRKVAIKALKHHLSTHPEIRKRFENEALLMANLHHPNIVALNDYVEVAGNIYLIMEYVEGFTLEKYIQEIQGPIPEPKAIAIFKKILEAFIYAHKKGIVHRDIKPANIMLTPDGQVKILDFGVAKNIKDENGTLTRAGIKLGTIFYMSPEQIRAEDVDMRSDIYSLGITLFEMLTGKNPYGQFSSEYQISQLIVNNPLPKAHKFYPNVSPFMQTILDKATAKNPVDRFQTVEEFRNTLLKKTTPIAVKENAHTKEWVFEPQIIHEQGLTFKLPDDANTKNDEPLKENSSVVENQNYSVLTSEKLLLDNLFGIITTRKVVFYRGLDLFDKGKKEELPIFKILSITLKSHREYLTGLSLLGIATYLFFIAYYWIIALIAVMLILLGMACLLPFPTIVIVRTDLRKIAMRSFPWHNRKASEYVLTIKELQEEK